MNRQKISLILLVIFLIATGLTLADALLENSNSSENTSGNVTVENRTVHYDSCGKCVEVVDGNTIQVYGVGRVQLTQVKTPAVNETGFSDAGKFTEEMCLGKTVYLDVDDVQPHDKYGRTLAVVYTDECDVNRELIDRGFAEISYFEPSEFERGEI